MSQDPISHSAQIGGHIGPAILNFRAGSSSCTAHDCIANDGQSTVGVCSMVPHLTSLTGLQHLNLRWIRPLEFDCQWFRRAKHLGRLDYGGRQVSNTAVGGDDGLLELCSPFPNSMTARTNERRPQLYRAGKTLQRKVPRPFKGPKFSAH